MTELKKRLLEKNGMMREVYVQRLVKRIHERYSIDDEIGILMQKETKPDEFEEHNAFVEQCKAEVKAELGIED